MNATPTLMAQEIAEAPEAVARFFDRESAALAEVGAQLARLGPPVVVTCARGSSDHASAYFKYLVEILNGTPVASLGPNVLQPLFQGGALVANRDAALARLDQALIVYRKTVNGALGEVANSLSAYQTSADLVSIEARRVTAAREALRLADLRFRAGITSFLELLDAQRQQLASETDAIQSELQQRQALINLYLALGGGWQPAPGASASAAGG